MADGFLAWILDDLEFGTRHQQCFDEPRSTHPGTRSENRRADPRASIWRVVHESRARLRSIIQNAAREPIA